MGCSYDSGGLGQQKGELVLIVLGEQTWTVSPGREGCVATLYILLTLTIPQGISNMAYIPHDGPGFPGSQYKPMATILQN